MTFVKPDSLHLAQLLDRILLQLRCELVRHDWEGLRPSHLRLMSMVPSEGVTITELAGRVGMTKQACGQFVTALETTDHLVVRTDPDDRRLRLVRRTAHGDAMVATAADRVARIEQAWRERVGADRFETFRAVLSELGTPPAE